MRRQEWIFYQKSIFLSDVDDRSKIFDRKDVQGRSKKKKKQT